MLGVIKRLNWAIFLNKKGSRQGGHLSPILLDMAPFGCSHFDWFGLKLMGLSSSRLAGP
jgi:hypothetical protein